MASSHHLRAVCRWGWSASLLLQLGCLSCLERPAFQQGGVRDSEIPFFLGGGWGEVQCTSSDNFSWVSFLGVLF